MTIIALLGRIPDVRPAWARRDTLSVTSNNEQMQACREWRDWSFQIIPIMSHKGAAGDNLPFFNEADYRAYLALLKATKTECGVEIWAYCLMPNHVHMIAVPRDENGLAKMLGTTHHRPVYASDLTISAARQAGCLSVAKRRDARERLGQGWPGAAQLHNRAYDAHGCASAAERMDARERPDAHPGPERLPKQFWVKKSR